MVLRAAWLPQQIRNASGNGGGVLLRYMPIVRPICVLVVMKTKIHDTSMKDECCYLVAAVLLTCLLDDMKYSTTDLFDHYTDTIRIGM